MAKIYSLIVGLHAVVGLVGLVVFWFPILLKKGSYWHRRIGRYFALAMVLAAASGLMLAILMYVDPIGIKIRPADLSPQALAFITLQSRYNAVFLTLLSILLFTTTQRSLAALKAKDQRQHLRRPLMLLLPFALGGMGVVVLWYSIQYKIILFGSFAVVAILLALANFWYAFKPRLKPREWVLEHLGNAIGSGIAAHTGFLVFGASSLLGPLLQGNLILIPWLAPTVIGLIAITITGFRYARKFGYGSKVQSSEPFLS